ncbi:MAG: SGNH/GDSL hydrolase family protein [Vicinamibacteria bacterium]|jgi:hypothetical protein|nr:SGNH/GDSL hydrolase family protein [Vicinamibacteria bacterium]
MLAGLEAGTRLLGLHFPRVNRPARGDGEYFRFDPRRGWAHLAHARGVSDLGGPDRGLVRINALGLRGDEPLPRRPGVPRIALLGDSYVFGVGVDEPHTAAALLAETLGQRTGSRPDVFNLGVAGYSTDQQWLLLEELAPQLDLDLVVHVACDNDFEANRQDFVFGRYRKPFFVRGASGLEPRNQPVPELNAAEGARLWLAEHVNVWNAVRTRRANWPPLQRVIDAFQVAPVHETGDDPVLLTFDLVMAQRAVAARHGAAYAVTNTGHRGEVIERFQALRFRLRREGVPVFGLQNVLEAARRDRPGEHWDFPRDAHWNVDAHRLAATEIADRLLDLGLVAPR